MKQLLSIILMVFALAWMAGCSENDCSLSNNPMNTISFMDSETKNSIKLPDTLTVTALGTDSILINRMTNASKLSLPLRYEGGTTSYIFKYTRVQFDTINTIPKLEIDTLIIITRDTLQMNYTDEKHFLSLDCGIVTYFNLNGIHTTRNLIDSVRILNPAIDEHEKTNIEIYLRSGN